MTYYKKWVKIKLLQGYKWLLYQYFLLDCTLLKIHEIISSLSNLPPVFTANEGVRELSGFYKDAAKSLTRLVERGVLVRLKRDSYSLAGKVDPLVAAAYLYHSSYISFQSALSFYQMIPERTEMIMSVTTARTHTLKIEAGVFVYHAQSSNLYSQGMTLLPHQGIMLPIATREKALLDTLASYNLAAMKMEDLDILRFVTESLRLDIDDINALSLKKIKSLATNYRNKAPLKLWRALSHARRR